MNNELEKEIRSRLGAIAQRGSYTADDLTFFNNLYWTGRGDVAAQIKILLDIEDNEI